VSRIWNFSRSEGGTTGTDLLPARSPGQPSPAPGGQPGAEWPPPEDEDDVDYSHYVTRPVRPIAQLAVRIALWGAVGLGALGGIVSMVVATAPDDEPEEAEQVDEEIGVPAPVAGTAELVVERWLTATRDDEDAIDELFVEPPPLDRTDSDVLDVLATRAVAGMRLEKGYWSVTIAAQIRETPSPPPLDDDATAAEITAYEAAAEPRLATWYVEVGIVGEVDDALKALTTPAIVPPPVLDEAQWLPSALPTEIPGADDRIAATVEDFLNALLAGRGDPGRYLAHNVTIPAVTPAPFAGVTVLELSGIPLEDDDDADVRLWVLAEVETASGTSHTVGYEIRAVENIDRWEIVSIWGAPSVDPRPEDEAEGDDDSPPTSAGQPPETTAPTETTAGSTTTTLVDPAAGEGGALPGTDAATP
jgi:hypothetical protein